MSRALDLRVELEDKVKEKIDPMTYAERHIAYKYLRGLGCSMENIDHEIDKLIRDMIK
jgi:hypothetical protein